MKQAAKVQKRGTHSANYNETEALFVRSYRVILTVMAMIAIMKVVMIVVEAILLR